MGLDAKNILTIDGILALLSGSLLFFAPDKVADFVFVSYSYSSVKQSETGNSSDVCIQTV